MVVYLKVLLIYKDFIYGIVALNVIYKTNTEDL